jgi:CheY-like chemotaxis protein
MDKEKNISGHSFLLTFGEESNYSEVRDLSIIKAMAPLLNDRKVSFYCWRVSSNGTRDAASELVNVSPELVIASIEEIEQGKLEFAGSVERPMIQLPEPVDLSKLTCLIIDNVEDLHIFFKVQSWDLKEIKLAKSFEEAWPLINTHGFDFIVVDMCPAGEYGGVDIMNILRKSPIHKNMIIIATTNYWLPGDKQRFVAGGFNGFIAKPISKGTLEIVLGEIFKAKLVSS